MSKTWHGYPWPGRVQDRPWWIEESFLTWRRDDGLIVIRSLAFGCNPQADPAGQLIPASYHPLCTSVSEGEDLLVGDEVATEVVDPATNHGDPLTPACRQAPHAAWLAFADRIDREWPKADPVPLATQVWLNLETGDSRTLLGVQKLGFGYWRLYWSDPDVKTDFFPPRGEVLVHGPGAPWQRTAEEVALHVEAQKSTG